MTRLTVPQLSRVASEWLTHHRPDLEVLGVTVNTGGSSYSEILFRIRDGAGDPSEALVGVFRNSDEDGVRRQLSDRLRPQ
jgi:hypothetical protein